MNCRITSALSYYAKEIIDAKWAVVVLIEETNTRPTAAFVSTLPTAITDLIQAKTAAPSDAEWISFGGNLNRFLAGLALWRDYFDSLAEAQP